jgi:mannose-6-phosphate isomerase
MKLYKLQPAFFDYLWGGTSLIKNWGKTPPSEKLAESWEVSLHPSGESRIEDGAPDGETEGAPNGAHSGAPLSRVLTKADWGDNCANFPVFPLMVRLIDTEQNVSIHVHPDNAYARAKGEPWGKTEMWYIMETKPEAGIYCGFKEPVTIEEYARRIHDGTLTDVLRFIKVEPGQAIKIEPGAVHTVCAGIVMMEINQNSNVTYRVYDYGRKDKDGNSRPLHIEEAKAVSTLTPYKGKNPRLPMGPCKTLLCASRWFSVYEYRSGMGSGSARVSIPADRRSFCALTFLEGEGRVNGQRFSKDESFLSTAGKGVLNIEGPCRFILTKVVKYYVRIKISSTHINGTVIDQDDFILAEEQTAAQTRQNMTQAVQNLPNIITPLLERAGLNADDVERIDITQDFE